MHATQIPNSRLLPRNGMEASDRSTGGAGGDMVRMHRCKRVVQRHACVHEHAGKHAPDILFTRCLSVCTHVGREQTKTFFAAAKQVSWPSSTARAASASCSRFSESPPDEGGRPKAKVLCAACAPAKRPEASAPPATPLAATAQPWAEFASTLMPVRAPPFSASFLFLWLGGLVSSCERVRRAR